MTIVAYCAPVELAEACAMLRANPEARPLAGGTDLLVQARQPGRPATQVIDLKRIAELRGVQQAAGTLRIGAATPCAELAAELVLRDAFPGLVEAFSRIGSIQIQGRCTLGGNLCNASPAADSTPALLANMAVAVIADGKGLRRIPVAEMLPGPGRSALAVGELLHSLELPLPGPRRRDASLRFIPRTEMDIAVANAAVSVETDAEGRCCHLRLAIGAVGPRALLIAEASAAMEGRSLDEAALKELASMARAAAAPIDDKRGTAVFRRHVVGVLARRCAQLAVRRVEAGS